MGTSFGRVMGAASDVVRWGVLYLVVCALTSCGGGSGGGGGPTSSADGSLYVGYYVEDAANNPEDPTIGAVLIRLPSSDGSFAGQMPFSYAGCASGSDVGTIAGNRSGNTFAGQWTGTMDGSAVGGSFGLTADVSNGTYSGSYANTAGKQAISVGACSYYVAAQGTVKLFPVDSSSPTGFVISVSSAATPTLSWPSLGNGVVYTLRVFDEACVQNNPSDAACFKGEVTTTALNVVLDSSWGLTAGARYRAVVTAQQAGGGFAGFSTVTFVAPVVSGGGTGGGTGNGGGSGAAVRGRLTIDGSGATALGSEFVAGADANGVSVLVVPTGPVCMLLSSGWRCSSTLSISWREYNNGVVRESVGVAVRSVSAVLPGPQPGTAVTAGDIAVSTADGLVTFSQFCDVALRTAPCATLTDLGITLDPVARTVNFTNAILPSLTGAASSIVLNGTLSY